MPLIAVAVAGVSLFAGGAAAIGAVVAGTATLATTLTAVATIGAVVGAVGAVTGDKTLSTVGLVMGAVGGIGSLAANAGLFGASATTDSLFGAQSLAQSGIPADEGSALIGAGGAGSIDGAAATAGLNSSAAVPDGLSAFNPTASASTASTGTGMINDPEAALAQGGSSQSVAPSGAANTPGLSPSGTAAAAHANDIVEGPVSGAASPSAPVSTAPAAPAAPVTAPPTAAASTTDPGTLSWLSKFAKDNPQVASMATYGLIQSAGSFIAGAFDTLKPAQVAALQAQANANNATAGVTNTQLTNMKQPLPTASRVTPAGGGLINTVTGAAA